MYVANSSGIAGFFFAPRLPCCLKYSFRAGGVRGGTPVDFMEASERTLLVFDGGFVELCRTELEEDDVLSMTGAIDGGTFGGGFVELGETEVEEGGVSSLMGTFDAGLVFVNIFSSSEISSSEYSQTKCSVPLLFASVGSVGDE
jgi:hypothetical protein